jgi:AAA domain
VVDGLLQTGFLYAMTAQTGTGKTAVALLLSQCVADGVPFAGREVQAGAVIYCAGENPDELRQRFLAMCDDLGRQPETFNIHFLTPRTSKGLLVGFKEVEDYARQIEGGIRCVIVDTAAAFFDGEDENSNTELGNYARQLRILADLPGRPAIVVPCHPVKNPKTRDECVPRGGGAFVNEVDGNLILWRTGDDTIELDWTRKFRGPPFDSVPFVLRQVETTTAKDAKGRPVRTVLAAVLDEQEALNKRSAVTDDEIMILMAMDREPGATSPTGIAIACGWLSHVGTETDDIKEKQRSRTRRRLKELKARKLVEQAAVGFRWHLTSKGAAEAKRLTGGTKVHDSGRKSATAKS